MVDNIREDESPKLPTEKTSMSPKMVGPEEAKDLTKEQVRMWWKRIRRERRRMRERHQHWQKTIQMFAATDPVKMNHSTKVPEVKVNLIPSTVALASNNLVNRDELIFGKSQTPEVDAELPALQNEIRRRWARLKPYTQYKNVVTDTLLTGTGFIKVGYSEEHFGGAPANKDGHSLENNDHVYQGSAWQLRVSPFRVFVDPNATDTDDAKWIAIEFIRPIEDVKRNPGYQNVNKIQASHVDEIDKMEKEQGEIGDDPFVRLYEVQDKASGATFVLAEGVKERTVVPPVVRPLPFDGFSIEMLKFTSVPDQFWGLSEVGQWLDQQRELSDLRSVMADWSKRWSWIWLVRKGSADPDQLDKLTAARSQSYVEVDVPEDIAPLQSPALSADFGALNQLYSDDIARISGIADFQRGQSTGAKTATEVSAIQQGTTGRGQFMREMVTDFKDRVADKFVAIEVELNIAPGEGFPLDDVEWRFEVPTMDSVSPEIQRKLMTDLYQLLIPNAMAAPDLIDPRELTAMLLEAFDVKEIERLMPPPASTGTGLTPGEENLLIMAGQQVEPTTDEDVQAHINEHMQLFNFPQMLDGSLPEALVTLIAHLSATQEMGRRQGLNIQIPLPPEVEAMLGGGGGEGGGGGGASASPSTPPPDPRSIGARPANIADLASASS